MKERGVSRRRTEAVKALLSLISWWVRLFLLMLTAIVGGSEVIWNTVLAICPLSLFPFLEPTTYRPYPNLRKALVFIAPPYKYDTLRAY
ncbi:hypothetical protein ES703_39757 [subsurface metagenome]